jgi:hypothetical protein
MMFPIWRNCSKEAANDTDGGSTRPAEAREPKPSTQRQAKEQQQRQQHQESAGHPPLISSIHPPTHPFTMFCSLINHRPQLTIWIYQFSVSFFWVQYHPYIYDIHIWKAKT